MTRAATEPGGSTAPSRPHQPSGSGRRESTGCFLAALIAALILFVAAGAQWASGSGRRVAADSFVLVHAATSGRSVAPLVAVAGLVALAAAAAVPATRGIGRRLAGVVVVAAGLAALVQSLAADPQGRLAGRLPQPAATYGSVWPFVAAAGAALLVATGVLLAARGPGWSSLSARYEAPAVRRTAAPKGDAALWDALDEGHDPTA